MPRCMATNTIWHRGTLTDKETVQPNWQQRKKKAWHDWSFPNMILFLPTISLWGTRLETVTLQDGKKTTERIQQIYKCWVTLQRWTRSNHLLPFPAETGSGWGNKEEEALEQTEDRSWAACTAAWPRWVSVLKNNPNKGYQPWWGPLEQAPNLCTLVWSAGLVGDRAPLWEVPSAVRKMDAFNQH